MPDRPPDKKFDVPDIVRGSQPPAGIQVGINGGLLTFPWVIHRPGSGGQRPACLSMASAIMASALWNPNARRVISLS